MSRGIRLPGALATCACSLLLNSPYLLTLAVCISKLAHPLNFILADSWLTRWRSWESTTGTRSQ